LSFLLGSRQRALGGARAGGLGAPTINAKKRIDGGHREVPEMEVQKLEMWMVDPLGVLPACPAAATTEVEDVDGGPPVGCYRHVW
jgi:hypothetical protein